MDRTNAERQRRWVANLKAAAAQTQAQDTTGLRQENIELRHTIAVLEQKLAQQRATAGSTQRCADSLNRRDGVAIEALKAAKSKDTGVRLWSDCSPIEADKNEATRPVHRLQIEDWVPKGAWPAIEETWEYPLLDESVRAALERLATDPRMRDVWRKLPRDVEEVVRFIIPWAVYALAMFPLLRPKPQSKNRAAWRRWEQHQLKLWVKHPHPSVGYDWLTCAGWARDLRDVVARMQDVLADETRLRFWRDDAGMKFADEAYRFLDALFYSFLLLDEEHRSRLKIFPPVARWDDPQAPQRFFGQFMSEKMQHLCGRHFDAVVAVLTAVAFDLDDLEPETVRGWRRNS